MTDAPARPRVPTSPLARPLLPRGFADRGSGEAAATERVMAAIRAVYEAHGFEAVETPLVERADALGKFLPDQDRPNAGVFAFRDDDEEWLSLRYDLTAPLARHYAANHQSLPKPYRSYRQGWVFRNEKPGPGRFRQFLQFDADTVGASSVAADAEMAMMMCDVLEAVGIARGDYVVKVSHRGLLDGVMESIELDGPEHSARRLVVLRAIDKFDRLGVLGVRQLLGGGRRDESGDFTPGAGLLDDQIDRVMFLPSPPGHTGVPAGEVNGLLLRSTADGLGSTSAGAAAVDDLGVIAAVVASAGYDDGRVILDRTVVRGLEYYTGPVFEAELAFPVTNDAGETVRFGSVAGGGRYDGLVARFLPEAVPATGFSIGVSRLVAALRAVGSPLVTGAAPRGPLVVLPVGRAPEDHAAALRLAAQLRDAAKAESSDPDHAGPRLGAAEAYLGAGGVNAQFKYADRRGAPLAVIQGPDERAAEGGPFVVVKDLVLGGQKRAGEEREAYQARQAAAQERVPEAGMLGAVRAVLARHAAGAA